jgi:hypothetical protein
MVPAPFAAPAANDQWRMSMLSRLKHTLASILLGAITVTPQLASASLDTCETAGLWRDPTVLYGDSLEFDVLRDGKRVGFHRVTFRSEANRLIVDSVFDIKVKVMFITAFEYQYKSTDTWQNGCLVELTAVTNDNGDVRLVEAALNNGVLRINGPSGAETSEPGLFPTNHWHPGVLTTNRVLNTITGRVASVSITDAGPGDVVINGEIQTARRYVYGGDLRTEVWYDSDGRWVKMRFRADDGSVIEYMCQKCGATAPSDRV